MRVKLPSLIVITDSSRYSDELLFAALEQALAHGVDAVLLREKALTSAKLLALASRLRELTTAFGVALYIHTQADIANAVDADGVHVGSGDVTNIPAIRRWLNNPEKTVSVSCHTAQELQLAEQHGADFVFLSPVFPTQSHPGSPHLGVKGFNTMASTTKLPVVALGGIDSSNCGELKGRRVAVIGAILGAEDPGKAAKALHKAIFQG
ncbi:thiamine-phosphate diphosphorylase [Mariprofundus aestuarium]|uniref:Thiamine-phosphate synthase n=1 Tax=Mariprofundus aestuarium TaxID=1921086 RepID=A0A2K8KV42_MARES|nr:thiamine phosphate synthase [Mariprofundus aestuarium]ATX78658.1 thiamine-phosphate diphosphorylase [Mariprofundus aestuarium]